MRVDLLCSAQHLERINICVQVANFAKQKLAALSTELIENDGKGVDDDEGLRRGEQKIWETHKMLVPVNKQSFRWKFDDG